jgi:hypothetical protein
MKTGIMAFICYLIGYIVSYLVNSKKIKKGLAIRIKYKIILIIATKARKTWEWATEEYHKIEPKYVDIEE